MQVSGALIHVYRIPGNAVSSITVVATRLAREKSFNSWFDGGVRASRKYGNKDYKKNLKARQKHGDAGMFEHCLVFRNTVINHHSIFKKQEEKRLIMWKVEWRCPGTKEAAVAVTETSGNSVGLQPNFPNKRQMMMATTTMIQGYLKHRKCSFLLVLPKKLTEIHSDL